MMKGIIIFAIVVILQFNYCEAQTGNKVKISVYYETLCPDSMNFLTAQLHPVYQALSEHVEIDLVPFGKANFEERSDGTIAFTCHHGPHECYGNKVQGCALNTLDTNTTMHFVNCMESSYRPQSAGRRCAKKLGINYTPIEACASNNQGQQILLAMGKRTKGLNPPVTFVPWIVINSVYNEETQNRSLEDLKAVICEQIQGRQLEACGTGQGLNSPIH